MAGIMSLMERLGTSRFIVVVGLSLIISDSVVTTSGEDDHRDYSDDVINAARCRVRCLTLLQVFNATPGLATRRPCTRYQNYAHGGNNYTGTNPIPEP